MREVSGGAHWGDHHCPRRSALWCRWRRSRGHVPSGSQLTAEKNPLGCFNKPLSAALGLLPTRHRLQKLLWRDKPIPSTRFPPMQAVSFPWKSQFSVPGITKEGYADNSHPASSRGKLRRGIAAVRVPIINTTHLTDSCGLLSVTPSPPEESGNGDGGVQLQCS